MRLYRIMQLRGAFFPMPATATSARDAAAALERCARCPRTELCDEVIRSNTSAGYGLFCPNTHYVEHLHSRSMKFT
jgi:hypothetical protein